MITKYIVCSTDNESQLNWQMAFEILEADKKAHCTVTDKKGNPVVSLDLAYFQGVWSGISGEKIWQFQQTLVKTSYTYSNTSCANSSEYLKYQILLISEDQGNKTLTPDPNTNKGNGGNIN